jgi:hypothetical protein
MKYLALLVRAQAKAEAAAAAKEAAQKISATAEVTDKPNEPNVAVLPLQHPHSPSANEHLPAAEGLHTPLQDTVHDASADNTSHGGRQNRTLTQFGLDHDKEVEERNAKAERLKLKKASTKWRGVQNKPAGVAKASGKGKKKLK